MLTMPAPPLREARSQRCGLRCLRLPVARESLLTATASIIVNDSELLSKSLARSEGVARRPARGDDAGAVHRLMPSSAADEPAPLLPD